MRLVCEIVVSMCWTLRTGHVLVCVGVTGPSSTDCAMRGPDSALEACPFQLFEPLNEQPISLSATYSMSSSCDRALSPGVVSEEPASAIGSMCSGSMSSLSPAEQE